jgi:hypothetical protein
MGLVLWKLGTSLGVKAGLECGYFHSVDFHLEN